MKITDEGYTITDVPGLESIKIVPAGVSGEVNIVLVPDEVGVGFPRSFDLEHAQELVEALERACRMANNMVNNNAERAS